MSVKIFVSHQLADSRLAQSVAARLTQVHQIPCYLDVYDKVADKTGDALGEYLRGILTTCTQLMAVVSENTKGSWWVPWEIGLATEKDYPIATFAPREVAIPEFLRKWPYLRTDGDLDEYAATSKTANSRFEKELRVLTEAKARRTATSDFHSELRRRLGQT